jgi:dihydroorotase
MHCDFAFFIGGTAENADRLPELERLPGCAGVKVFIGSSTGSLLVEDDENLERILRVIRRRASFHAEDEFRLRARKGERKPGDPSSHPVWRDVEAARLATERLLNASRRTGARVHVLHISTADELPLLAAHRERASVEVTPQHLTFSAPEVYERWGNLAQMNPPLREAHHAAALWRAVRSGLVDVLGSDHAPHTLEEKGEPYPQSPSGMPGVQTLVPVMLDHVNAGRLSIERFVDLTSHGPARLFGIAGKGRIAEGYDADFTVVDLKARRTITRGWMANRSNWTPFEGREVTGWPVATVLRGLVVMRDGELVGPSSGQAIRFSEGLPAA